jgi:putative FmdB family regulatory protein
MPIYEFACQSCGHEFEVLVMGAERPECPECGTKKLDKKFSTFSSGGSSTPDCDYATGSG